MNDDEDPRVGWCLRFIDGALAGRTIALKPGANLIGSASDCDILLPGPAVWPRHASLMAGDVAVALQRLQGAPLQLNATSVTAQRRGLVAGDCVKLGDVAFELQRLDASDDEADADFLQGAAASEPAAPPLPALPLHMRLTRKVWGVFAGGFALSIALLWWGLGPVSARPGARDSEAARLSQILNAYPEAQVIAGADGQLQVSGFVESPLRLHALTQELAPLAPRVTVRVQVVEQLVEQARRFIADPAVAVSYGGKGRLVISGATESATVQDKIARLGEDLHPAVLVSDKVQYKPRDANAGNSEQALWARWQELLPARIVSITEGADGMRHIQLANGQRYYEGALLKSGARLEIARPDELVLAPEGAP